MSQKPAQGNQVDEAENCQSAQSISSQTGINEALPLSSCDIVQRTLQGVHGDLTSCPRCK